MKGMSSKTLGKFFSGIKWNDHLNFQKFQMYGEVVHVYNLCFWNLLLATKKKTLEESKYFIMFKNI